MLPSAVRLVCLAAMAVVGAAFAAPGAVAEQAPRVVVSIPPLHSLIAGVMAGVGAPTLLVEGGSSPHAYSLRPAAAQALANADAVFWIGPDLETFLPKPIAALATTARVVTVMDDPEIAKRHNRASGAWEDSDGHDHEAGHGPYDPHVWLDPRNAMRIVALGAAVLSELDPPNSAAYAANAARLAADIGALEADLAAMLAPVQSRPFIVFHDAYQYLEGRFGLHAVGAFALTPGQAPGARRVTELRRRIAEAGVTCVFVEPQFEPAVVKAAVAGTGARVAVLDPLGAALPPGEGQYDQLLRALADSFLACLGGPP